MADLSPLIWRPAEITAITSESARVKTFRLKVDGDYPFLAGQHCSVQVRHSEGQAMAREYSFSSSPSSGNVEITIARIQDGELSHWFNDEAVVGDVLELSPAIGGFRWTKELTNPVLLIGGGIGIAPLASMWREHQLQKSRTPMQLLYSCRNVEDICFKDELLSTDNVHINISNLSLMPPGWAGGQGRLDQDQLRPYVTAGQSVYVCGSSAFVADIANTLIGLDVNESHIRREMFS